MAISPGAYLALRRNAAGMTIEQVAQSIDTVPHLAERDRLIWLRMIEANEMPMTAVTVDSLRKLYPFSRSVLAAFDRLHRGLPVRVEPQLCRECGCSEFDPCNASAKHNIFVGCHWVAEDLCSSCALRLQVPPAPIGAAA